jgi:hypothetical protein
MATSGYFFMATDTEAGSDELPPEEVGMSGTRYKFEVHRGRTHGG